MSVLTREALCGRPRRLLHAGRNWTKAMVEVVDTDGGPVVVKDLLARAWPVRFLLGPLQLDRETGAYRRLAGLPGVPRFLARVDRMAIALEYVDGPDLSSVRPGTLPAEFFDRLERTLEEIHGRGVAHGDLSRRDILVAPGGEPAIVDFSTSIVADADADPLLRFLFSQMCLSDRRALAKIRRRLVPGSDGHVPPRPRLYRIGHAVKSLWVRLRGRPPSPPPRPPRTPEY